MDFSTLLLITIILGAAAIFVVVKDGAKKTSKRRARSQRQPALVTEPYAAEDKRFDDAILKAVGSNIDKHFYTKLVGITHENEDGTLRESLIATCKPFDPLEVVWEPNNRYDPNAIAIHKTNGRMLGYLNSRTAEEVARSMKRGTVWQACVNGIAEIKGQARVPRNLFDGDEEDSVIRVATTQTRGTAQCSVEKSAFLSCSFFSFSLFRISYQQSSRM
jgi:hypothetical protein